MLFTKRIKRTVTASFAAAIALSASLPAWASAPSYQAPYSTPVIDGVINASEYGAPQNLNKSNASIFFCKDVDVTEGNNVDLITFPNLTYRFAWDDQNLYVAITVKSVENVITSDFQIDLSPEKGIRDKQKGIFLTFNILDAKNNKMSVARNNYQTPDNIARDAMNITSKVKTAVKTSGDTVSMEIGIPITELRVKPSRQLGNGKDYTGLTMQASTWGVGAYFVGNGAGFTSTKGAGNHTFVSNDIKTGKLVEYYNDMVLGAKPANTNASPAPGNNNSSKTASAKQESKAPGTSSKGSTVNSGGITSSAASDTQSLTESTGAGSDPESNTGSALGTINPSSKPANSSAPVSSDSKGLPVVIIVLAVLILAGGGTGAYFFIKKR